MDKPKKNYVGGATKRDGQYGEYFTAYLNVKKLQEFQNDKGFAKVIISLNREPWKFWETHSIIEDTYKPKPKIDFDAGRPSINDVPW